MKFLFLDFETYYDQTYSLRKMTPVEYILDPRFECIGAALAVDHYEARWVEGPTLHKMFALFDPNDTIIVSHNALFDACIVEWVFNFRPKLWVDTMSMARALIAHDLNGVSLEKVASYLKLGVKGKAIYKAAGMHLADLKNNPIMYQEYREYARTDCNLCRSIYWRLRPDFPTSEMVLNDMIIRCTTEPKFILDDTLLHQHLYAEQARKQALLDRIIEITPGGKKELMSGEKFAELLRSFGVNPPMKVSPNTGNRTYAFAKTDRGMVELLEHENPDVQAVVSARLGVKSTIEETRTQRFISISQLEWPAPPQKRMPIPLNFSGAHTHRFSGGWSINAQNLGRDSNLRRSLKAPEGHTIVACDASQIEARLAAWLAKEESLVAKFANGEDVYSDFASDSYGYPVNKRDHPSERLLGKISVLALNFGMGAPKFRETVRVQARAQNVDIEIDDVEAARVVRLYRTKYKRIEATWNHLNSRLGNMARDKAYDEPFGPCRLQYRKILLPSGLYLNYNSLAFNDGWEYYYLGQKKYIYGGKLLENIVQALDRVCVMDAALRLAAPLRRLGIGLAHQVHDEIIYIVPDDLLDTVIPMVREEMRRRPSWGWDLPLDAEVKIGPDYGSLKEVK